MRRLSGIGAVGLLLVPQPLQIFDPPPRPIAIRLPAPVSLTVLRGSVARNGTLEKALANVLTPAAVQDLVRTARPLYNLARLSVGHAFDLTVGAEGLLAFSYAIDELRTLQVRRIRLDRPARPAYSFPNAVACGSPGGGRGCRRSRLHIGRLRRR